ncbi:MotA/TolQ/ExbB proton channel family protein [Mesoterricola sediminis]|uniref:Tol-Pal system subunit TolQ n=1 Tax=Mesoterricola sediminis TaxID=2927980 RepID=A0AA48KC01_9BACT|nr:MotA/TolQ/ExbB proton channel family protein [Mesoterricola sediminis]BDU76639.1 Tol-Pal system subunit TolQ [Mesoterricola sediminis]
MPYVGLMAGQGVNLWEVVLHSGTVARAVLLILCAFSVTSWVIIVQKGLLLSRSGRATEHFRSVFRKATDWRELKQRSGEFAMSPLVGLFTAGFSEVTYQLRPGAGTQGGRPQIKSMEAVERCLQRASVVEMGRMETYLGILATIAAVSPFVGLFGTVWGIIDAFHGIGMAGNASLATVAPGISEALVATALGLVAAIPALMAYNFFQGQLKHWQTELDDFALEFISLSERNFT